jgi:hypothetical protein
MRPAEHFDVAVVGGGSAGVAAAVSAAELGARTLLIERERQLGGNVAHAFVHTICGLYRAASEGDAVALNPGLPSRIGEGLRAAGVAGAAERAGRVYVLPIDPPRYAAFLAELCARTDGLEVRTESELIAVDRSNEHGRFWSLRSRNGQSLQSEATTGWLVDTTGDANVAAFAEVPLLSAKPEEVQLPSFIFQLAGVDRSELAGFEKLRLTHAVASAVRDGDLPEGCESVLVRPGAEDDAVYITLNLPREGETPYLPLDENALDSLASCARDDAEKIVKFLQRTRPAFEKSRISAWPGRVGVRESRRILGVRELEAEDVLSGRSDPDEVARSSWPIELWHDHRRAAFEYPKGPCSIPLGALISRTDPQLAMAGRCLSASHEALGALRVIGTALATGEAVGVAAALAADSRIPFDAVAASDVRGQIIERADRGVES